MSAFRSIALVLALLAFAACPAAASAHHRGDGDSSSWDPGSNADQSYDDGSDYADEGDYGDDVDSADDVDDSEYAGDDADCVAYLEDPEGDGANDDCLDLGDGEATDAPADLPDFDPGLPRIPRPVGPTLVHLHANGKVWASPKLPRVVRRVISAANQIATRPYKYGGGHGSFISRGYDCSGSVSYALHGGGLLFTTLTSGGLAHWGAKGKGKWITIYANASHTYMVVGGMRFDTGARARGGTRWDPWQRPARGFAVRHPAGL